MQGRKEQTIGESGGGREGDSLEELPWEERYFRKERAKRGSTYLALVCKRARSDMASRTGANAMKVLFWTEGR